MKVENNKWSSCHENFPDVRVKIYENEKVKVSSNTKYQNTERGSEREGEIGKERERERVVTDQHHI